jgi:hypothetical protein
MNTQNDSKLLDWYLSSEAEKAKEVGRRHNMTFEIVGRGELPSERVYIEGWWYETLKSLANIPSEGLERLVLLQKAGIEIKGLIIAHEMPKPAKTQPQAQPEPHLKSEPAKTDTDDHFDPMPAVKVFLGVLGAVATVLGILFIAAANVDPKLIVVLKDNTWCSVYEWLE